MSRALAIRLLTLAAVVLVLSSVAGGPYSDIVFAVVAVAFPALLMFLGTAGRKGRRSQVWVILGLVVLLEACLVGMLALRGTVATGGWFLGLPAVTALQIYGMCLLPLTWVAFGFAATFADFRVEKSDLERVRRTSPSDPNA